MLLQILRAIIHSFLISSCHLFESGGRVLRLNEIDCKVYESLSLVLNLGIFLTVVPALAFYGASTDSELTRPFFLSDV